MTRPRPGAERAHLGRVQDELRALTAMTVGELRARYAAVFGEPSRSRNKPYLRKKIAYKLQERAQGGLSARARARAAELAPKALDRLRGATAQRAEAALAPAAPPAASGDPRRPPTGAVLRREHRGVVHEVRVTEGGYEHRGERYKSLSGVAKAITGTSWNGYAFFREALEAVAAAGA
ncbi:MAG TPA: DUF2924 domain-containing protein [Polyangiaceae bacterium]|nr:DUF2924 domain-containing protein [Polyangiaceae bacterium]